MDVQETEPRPVKTFSGEGTSGVSTEEEWTEDTCKLLKDISVTTVAVDSALKSLIRKIKSSALDTEQGHSFLQLRNVLMVEYLLNLSEIIATKVSKQSLVGSPAIERAVEVRTYMEKMKPIHLKLKYQIEKALRAASDRATDAKKTTSGPDDVLSLRPKLEDIQLDDEEEKDDEDGSDQEVARDKKKYVPPKVASVPYDEDETGEEKKTKRLERARRRALNSNLMKELMEEMDEVPEEIQESTVGRRKTDLAAAERTRFEEENFIRITTKKEKKRKKQETALMTIGDLGSAVTRFDDVSALDRRADDDDDDDPGPKRKKSFKNKAASKKRPKKVIPKRILMRQRGSFRRK